MMKDKAVRKAEFKEALINGLKSLIAPAIGILVIVGIVLLVKYLQKPEEAETLIEMRAYTGSDSDVVVENEELKMVMDPTTTQFSLEVKDTGAVWYSNPTDIEASGATGLELQKLNSTLLLYYSTQNGVDTLFNNYKYSIENGLYEIEQGEDYIKVLYTIGDQEKEFVIPIVIEQSRMEEYMAQMDVDGATLVKDYYKLYDINNLGKKDNKEELLSKYPMLSDTVIYVLRDTVKDNIKKKLAEHFETVGYTYEEYEADKEFAGEAKASDKPIFNVSIIYRLEGKQLVVDVPLEEIQYRTKYPVYNMCVLPYFGAGSTSEDGYMMVPEGGGAIINFNNGKVSQNSYYSDLYGWDRGLDRDAVVHETHSYFNAFGIAKNQNSFLCILEDGASYAGVFADISGKQNNYNFVYPQYSIIHREKYEVGSRYEGAIYMYEKDIPKEHLTERFCFIDSDSYVDMAKNYQDYLISFSDGRMVMADDTSVPTEIEIVGAVDKIEQICGIPKSMPLALTTYKEAKTILEQLNAEGMSNMSVKMTGWANHGVQQRILNKVKLISRLGNKKDLTELTNYAKNNGIDLYLNGVTDYAYDSDVFDGFMVFTDAARYVNNKRAEIYPYSTVYYSAREKQDPYYLLKPELCMENVKTLSDYAKKVNANVAFEEIGMDLSADYHKNAVITRETVRNNEISKLAEVKAGGTNVMINMGNSYAVPYADFITNMSLVGYRYSIIDATVPVYQMALHGYCSYAGESLNMTQNFEEDLLNAVEYGAGLSFTLMDESAFTLQGSLYTEYFGAEYDSVHDRMMETYTRYNNELGHTFNQKMVDHEIVSSVLRKVTYEDGTEVYVNYGYDEAKTPDGKSVAARDYLVVR